MSQAPLRGSPNFFKLNFNFIGVKTRSTKIIKKLKASGKIETKYVFMYYVVILTILLVISKIKMQNVIPHSYLKTMNKVRLLEVHTI